MTKYSRMAATLAMVLALAFTVACSGQGSTAPTAASGGAAAAGGSGAFATQSVVGGAPVAGPLTPIGTNPALSCPSDAPIQMRFGSKDYRLDLEWSGIDRANRYEVEIDRFDVDNQYEALVRAVSNTTRYETFVTTDGGYRARVRTTIQGCAPGRWSSFILASVNH